MLVFVTRRLVVSFFILLASTALTFFLVAYSGNPLQDLLELRGPQRDAKVAARTQSLHLDQPGVDPLPAVATGRRPLPVAVRWAVHPRQ